MYDNKKLVIGVAPTRRGISSNRKGAFTPKAAKECKDKILETINGMKDENVEFVNIDWLNKEGIMYDVSHADEVAEYFKKEKVDAIFVPHCNFGCEEAAGRLAKLIQKPVLLWGPRDEKIGADGSRATDTQCGLFASSRLMMRYGVPFTYIENCWIWDEKFKNGFKNFISVAAVVKSFKNMRIGQINSRPKFFTSVMYNESELMEKFGIEVVPINIATVKEKMDDILLNGQSKINEIVADIKSRIDSANVDEEWFTRTAALKITLRELAKLNNCSGLAVECWTITLQILKVLPCFVIGELTNEGLPVSCETDINGAITSVLLSAAARGKTPSFFGEYTMRHPEDENSELIWHCGPFPYSLKKESSKAEIIDGRPSWEIKGGDITVARFDGDRGNYKMFAGHACGTDGPWTTGTFIWAKVDNWAKWENKFINGPYIHHVSCIHGHYGNIIKEACKYIPGLDYDCPDL
jgi:L-fucose isomerase-like protein